MWGEFVSCLRFVVLASSHQAVLLTTNELNVSLALDLKRVQSYIWLIFLLAFELNPKEHRSFLKNHPKSLDQPGQYANMGQTNLHAGVRSPENLPRWLVPHTRMGGLQWTPCAIVPYLCDSLTSLHLNCLHPFELHA